MSHRALVAVARPDGGYDVVLARDGATDRLVSRLRQPGAELPAGFVDRPPLGRADSFDDVLAAFLDPIEHEALLVVDRDGRVTPHAVLPYVLGTAGGLIDGDPAGATLALVGGDGSTLHPAYARGWTHGTAGVLGEAIDGGLVTDGEALAWFDDRTRRLAGDQLAYARVAARRE